MAHAAAQPRVAIIGGGPAGLTLAKLLQKQQQPCTIFESDESRRIRDQGGSLDLHQDAGIPALKKAGLYDAFLRRARPEGEVLRIVRPDGQLLMNEGEEEGHDRPQELQGRPEIDRADLLEILTTSLAPGTIHWGHRLVSIQEPASPGGRFQLGFEDGHTDEFDVVVGADGAWSKVRPLLTEVAPEYSGIGGFDARISDAPNRYPHLSARCGNGTCLTVGADKAIISQRNGGGNIRTYAFLRLPEAWQRESGLDFGHPAQALAQFVDTHYSDWDAGARDMVLQADPQSAVPRNMYMLPVGLRWKSRPSLTLIGDAAHLMTPFGGAGVNVAMQDALVLSDKLLEALGSSSDTASTTTEAIAGAIASYEAEMFDRAQGYAEQTSMYLNLLFQPRGAIAMVEAFEMMKQGQGGEQ